MIFTFRLVELVKVSSHLRGLVHRVSLLGLRSCAQLLQASALLPSITPPKQAKTSQLLGIKIDAGSCSRPRARVPSLQVHHQEASRGVVNVGIDDAVFRHPPNDVVAEVPRMLISFAALLFALRLRHPLLDWASQPFA